MIDPTFATRDVVRAVQSNPFPAVAHGLPFGEPLPLATRSTFEPTVAAVPGTARGQGPGRSGSGGSTGVPAQRRRGFEPALWRRRTCLWCSSAGNALSGTSCA